ncbi:MAG TPA: alpha/beta fold hydrolase [Actinomycetota bacterium]|jgi:pimeloyl-ACP methyl ester carboxylesterase|nr:alpha/beta fold hydrolase [Actinomycetota bacterium]
MKIKVGDVEFGYDRAGSGDPVLLVMGLATPRIGWFHQFHFLSQRYDVTSFDNRGVGETVADSPFTMLDMANDALGMADAMGYERFHLVGISMGGMISQELVLNHPDRVRSLTLIATTPGGPEAVPMSAEYAQALTLPDPAERMRRSVELTFGSKFRRENPELMELILQAMASGSVGATPIGVGEGAPAGFIGQVTAVVVWMSAGGSASRLGRIAKPTLVLHGGDDLLLPVGNGRILARDIPGARFRMWDDAGHALNAEYPDEVNAELVGHFESAEARV